MYSFQCNMHLLDRRLQFLSASLFVFKGIVARLCARSSVICYFLKRQQNCHIDATTFPSVPPTEICSLHSQVIFLTFEEILRHIKIQLSVRRLIVILSLARPPRYPRRSFRLLLNSFSTVKHMSEVNLWQVQVQ